MSTTETPVMETIELEGYRGEHLWRKVRFIGRLIYEDEGCDVYVTKAGTLVEFIDRADLITEFDDFPSFVEFYSDRHVDMAAAFAAIAVELGIDYAEEIE